VSHSSSQTFLRDIEKKLWTGAYKLPVHAGGFKESGRLTHPNKNTGTCKLIDDALEAVEKENPKLKNVPVASFYDRRTLKYCGVSRKPYRLTPNRLRLRITFPLLAEQKRIAHILGTLDDKIELNRRMNATLEALAQALFQSWFVDFDPVKRNAEGGAKRPEDSLFPDSFEDSVVGDIPRGWTVERVGDVVDCVGGGTPSTKEQKFWDDGVHHWTTPKDFSSLQSPTLIDTSRKLTNAGIAKISSGLLPAGTLLLSSRAPVGYLAISAIPVAINQGFIAMKCNHRASNYFMLNWCQSNMGEINSRATGTTFPEISKNSFRPISIVLPPKELMTEFTARVVALYTQITANLHQSITLEALRDTLLPRLLSGKLSVSELVPVPA
jgi:type I restriction enzyme, S subunit